MAEGLRVLGRRAYVDVFLGRVESRASSIRNDGRPPILNNFSSSMTSFTGDFHATITLLLLWQLSIHYETQLYYLSILIYFMIGYSEGNNLSRFPPFLFGGGGAVAVVMW